MEEIKERKRILLCDGWNIMLGMNAVSNVLDENTMQIGMYLGTVNMIRTFVDRFKPHKVIFALDGPQAGERRRKLYSGYKAGRRVKAKTSTVVIQEDDDEYTKYTSQGSFTFQLGRIYEFLKTLPITTVIVPYCEGDDLITYLAIRNRKDYHCIVISGDKDYLQLCRPGISVYNWREKILYDEEVFKDRFKILPLNYIYMKILLGDVSDEIKGIKGIGKKTFPVFHELLSEKVYDNVGEFIEATKAMDFDKLSTREKNAIRAIWSEEAVENMFLLFQVMCLDENCLKLQQIETLRQQVEEQNGKQCSRMTATIMMQKHQFNKLYNGFNKDKWIQPFSFLKPNVNIEV